MRTKKDGLAPRRDSPPPASGPPNTSPTLEPATLAQASESLRKKDDQIQAMANVIKALTEEIETTHRGLMAIHKELDERGIELFEAKVAAEAANLIYEALLQAASDLGQGVILSRGPTQIHYVNDAFAKITGRDLPELLASDHSLMRFLCPPSEGLAPAWTSAEGESAGRHHEASIDRPDGSTAHVEIASTDFAVHGETYRLALVRDISKTKHATDELDNARRQLAVSEKLAALGSLVSGVAHEVRTPLTIIATNLHVLEGRAARSITTGDYAPLAVQVPRITSEVLSAIERVQGLVKSLSRFTQTRSFTIESQLDPIVREAVDLYAVVNRSHTRVVSELHASHPVLVDKSQVQQIVINLIENAVQATRPGGEPVSIRTFTDAEGTGAWLEVQDHGIGMTPETRARMFEPLFTTKTDGTGVGLAIVHRIVQEHNGTIECASEPGIGTTMTIHFPGTKGEARGLHPGNAKLALRPAAGDEPLATVE